MARIIGHDGVAVPAGSGWRAPPRFVVFSGGFHKCSDSNDSRELAQRAAPRPRSAAASASCGGDTTFERRLWRAEDSNRVFGSSFRVVDGRYLTYATIGGDLLAAPVDLETGRVGRAVRMATGLGLAIRAGEPPVTNPSVLQPIPCKIETKR